MTTRHVYPFVREPPTDVFRALLAWAARRDAELLLVVRDQLDLNAYARSLLERLAPDLVASTKSAEWPGTQLLGHEARLFRYRVSANVIEVAGSRPEGLFHWLQPDLPEDPAILRPDGSALLTTIAHEGDAWLSLDDAEYRGIANDAPHVVSLLGPRE